MITAADFEKYYALYNTRLLTWVRSKFPCDPIVDDMVAETWMRVWKYRETFRGESGFYTWLSQIAINVIREYLRKEQRQVVTEPMPLDWDTPLTHGFILDSGENLPQRMLAKFALDRIYKKCSRQEQKMITLRFVYGFEYQEIGKKLKVNQHTMKTRIHRLTERITS